MMIGSAVAALSDHLRAEAEENREDSDWEWAAHLKLPLRQSAGTCSTVAGG